jgi:hypothetical protein
MELKEWGEMERRRRGGSLRWIKMEVRGQDDIRMG